MISENMVLTVGVPVTAALLIALVAACRWIAIQCGRFVHWSKTGKWRAL